MYDIAKSPCSSKSPYSNMFGFLEASCADVILAIYSTPLRNRFAACVWLFLQAQEGHIYFTELAERVEYGKYGCGGAAGRDVAGPGLARRRRPSQSSRYVYIYIYIEREREIDR